MSVTDEFQTLERNQFFNGQRLFASDLQAIDSFQREMRELHNRSLHQAGVGSGFAVAGNPGDREVTIGPGYAIDDRGQEIVHTQTIKLQIPPVESDPDGRAVAYYLTVSYPTEDDLEESETRQGVCLPRGVVRLREEPLFCWIRLERTEDVLKPIDATSIDDIQRGKQILLATVEVLQCKLDSIAMGQRRNARPQTQPFIACGTESNLTWRIDNFQAFREGFNLIFVFLSAKVEVGSHKFVNTPCYSARIEGQRVFEFTVSDDDVNPTTSVLVESLVSVRGPQPDGFTVQAMTLAASNDDIPDPNPKIAANVQLWNETVFSKWKIVWMGIE